MKSKPLSRVLSLLLVATLLIQMLPVQTFAVQDDSADIAEQAEATAPVTILGEEVSLRGEAEKHFRLSDGSYLAVTYGTPVHYQDNAGDWQDIDNRPIMATSVDGVASYQISNADKSTSFSSALTDGTLFSTSAGDYSVSMHLLDTVQATEQYRTAHMTANSTVSLNMSVSEEEYQVFSRNAVAEIEENVELFTTDEEQTGWKVSDLMPKYLSSSIIYEDVFQGVDLRYEASGYNIKEEIIIYQPQDSYRFDFMLTLDGLTAQLNEDGSIDLLNESDTVIYEIPAPYMYDGAGEYSKAVTYAVLEVENGAILTVVADDEWINDTSREFPVTIDPTLNLIVYNSNNAAGESLFLSYVKESAPNATAQGTKELWIGYGSATKELRGYIHVNELPALPAGSFVTQATLNLYMGTFNAGSLSEIPLGIFEVTSDPSVDQSYQDWIKYMTWNTKADYNDNNLIDYVTASSNTLYYKNNYGPMSWDMTELVKKWYSEKTDGENQNRTVTLGTTTQHTSSQTAACVFWAYHASYAPTLVVSYRNNTGIEPYYTYTTLGAGAAGAAYIADGTGQLKITKQVLGYASSVNPFSLSLVYNSDYFASSNGAEHHPMSNLGLAMSVGSGWRLDCVQKIETEDISGTTYLKYYDGDGTIHYFMEDSSRGSDYYDEDGLGLKIAITNNTYVMSDDNGNTWTFTNNFLTECADESGNKQIINYDGNRLTSVIQKNASADTNYTGITVATFAYHEDDRLDTVTDAAGNVFTLCYAENENKLTAIKQGDNVIAQYAYDGNRVDQMTDVESGYSLVFTYTNAGRIGLLKEQSPDPDDASSMIDGASVAIDYPSYAQTTYRDYGKDRALNTSDDLLTYYLFDYAGRTVNVYTTDASGKILGASNAVYSGTGSTDKRNNRTLRTATIGVASQHLLQNPSFEAEDGWNFGSSRQQTNARTGKYALALTQNVTSSAVNLIGGTTYTFSAYVDTSAASGFSGRGIYLKAGDTCEGIPINYKTSADDKWARISVTFTAPTDGTYTFSICRDGVSGTVYVDDVQLETGEAPSNYNLLENGSFSMGKNCWVTPDASTVTNGALTLVGSPNDATANASQTVQINLPSTETYVLSGWVTANAVPDTENKHSDPAQDTSKQCGLRAAIHYADGTVEYHYVPFNTDLSTKQFVSYTIVPNPKDVNGNPVVKTVDHIVVTCAYETNANTASFDDISLVREVTQTMEYDEDGNLKSVTTSGLNVDVNTYEGGNLIQTVTGSQGVYKYDYDDTYTHRLMSVTNQNTENSPTEWITQSMVYDDYGNVISTTLSGPGNLTMSTSAEYTSNGNLLSSVTDATGANVTYGYEEITHNGNVLTTAEYSRMMGLPTAITAPNGTTTYTAYDLYGRVTQTSVADLATLLYNYSKGNLHEITRSYIKDGQEKTQTYTLDYDPFGNTTSIKVGTKVLASYTYGNTDGLLKEQIYSNGHKVDFTYDNLGRTKTVTYSNVAGAQNVEPYTITLTYAYTGDGQLHSVTETNGSNSTVYLYRYDSLGNLVGSEKHVGDSLVLRTNHSYDNDNRLSAQGWQIGTDSFSQTYSYGEWDGNLSSIVLSKNNSSIAVNYTYDSLRRLSSVGNGIFTSTYSYWDDDESSAASPQLKSIVHDGVNYGGKVVECNYTYGYDANGNITSAAFGIRENTYVYDANNQLIRENNDRRQYTQVWEYDACGNITATRKYAYTTTDNLGDPTSNVSYKYTNSDWGDLLTTYNGLTIDYDNIGNPLSVTDAQGNVVKSYTWERGRQLKTLTKGATTWTYTYDADGLRTGRTDGTNTFEYIYAGDKLVRLVKNGEVVDFGYAGGQLATMSYDGATYYYVLNGQGDVVALTDNTGKMIIGYHYSAYGFPTLLKTDSETYTDLKYLNPFMYRGYVFDIETLLYYLQSRYYDPELGRFINADALVSTGQGILGNNMFAYCLNNPVNGYDPSGICTTFLFGLIKIDCHNVNCPDSIDYNPDAYTVAVLYDSRFAGYFGYFGDDGFDHQAQELIKRLSSSYNVESYGYVTMDEFIESWNSLDGTYVSVFIIGHGQAGKFNAIGGSLSAEGQEYNYSMLNSVRTGWIELYICNGATSGAGQYSISTAQSFANLTGAIVHAVKDGKLNFTWFGCYPKHDIQYEGEWSYSYPEW